MMGHQRGFDDERGLMFFRIMDIVRVKHPPYILLENVKNLYTHDKRRTFTRIVEELKAAGYNVVYDIFNTQDFCLPQTRNRVLIFATLEPLPNNFIFSSKAVKECFEFNKSRMSVRQSDTVIGILEKNVPDKYMLSERIKPTLLADGSAGFKSKSEINQLIARPLTASMHKMHRACQDNYYSLDFIASDGAVNQAINLSKDEQARLPIRKLTPKEAMLLQGFPEDFAAKASAMGVADGALYKQAGNAVSVNTIYAVLFYLITNKIIQ
ncbi:MAG: DNA (cytosine-5-)-methyltransferase [Bacteroides uniformis]